MFPRKIKAPFFTPNKDLPLLLPRTEKEADSYLKMIYDLFEEQGAKSVVKRDADGFIPFLPNPEFPQSMIPRLHEYGFKLPGKDSWVNPE